MQQILSEERHIRIVYCNPNKWTHFHGNYSTKVDGVFLLKCTCKCDNSRRWQWLVRTCRFLLDNFPSCVKFENFRTAVREACASLHNGAMLRPHLNPSIPYCCDARGLSGGPLLGPLMLGDVGLSDSYKISSLVNTREYFSRICMFCNCFRLICYKLLKSSEF